MTTARNPGYRDQQWKYVFVLILNDGLDPTHIATEPVTFDRPNAWMTHAEWLAKSGYHIPHLVEGRQRGQYVSPQAIKFVRYYPDPSMDLEEMREGTHAEPIP